MDTAPIMSRGIMSADQFAALPSEQPTGVAVVCAAQDGATILTPPRAILRIARAAKAIFFMVFSFNVPARRD
jgi:hypothetical protein